MFLLSREPRGLKVSRRGHKPQKVENHCLRACWVSVCTDLKSARAKLLIMYELKPKKKLLVIKFNGQITSKANSEAGHALIS